MNVVFWYLTDLEKVEIQLGDKFCYGVLAGRSATSLAFVKEIVLATTAGYTDAVVGHAMVTNNELKAYEKVVRDWNVKTHCGHKQIHHYGKWAIV